jgi:hypothetical protein
VIPGAHVKVFEERVQPARGAKQIGWPIPNALSVEAHRLGEALSLPGDILQVQVDVDLFSEIAVELRRPGLQEAGGLQRRHRLPGKEKRLAHQEMAFSLADKLIH